MAYFKTIVCVYYALVAIAQTLTTRYLFRTLDFKYYSTVFLLQRILIIVTSRRIEGALPKNIEGLLPMVPYAFIMCTINILSSYCITIMPLAAFMAFKKFVILFVLIVGLCLGLPDRFNNLHRICIMGIVIGGIMIGEKQILKGNFEGYALSLIYTLFQAVSLQYATLLYQQYNISPQGLMVANSILSMPYYIFALLWEREYEGIFNYFTRPISPFFPEALIFTLILAVASEYTGNIIAMKISPFEKASISNIKDLILTMISIRYFKDVSMNPISQIGILCCLAASVIFSITLRFGDSLKQLDWQDDERSSLVQFD